MIFTRRRRRAGFALLAIFAMFAGLGVVPLATTYLRAHRSWAKMLRARMRGAHFVGESGTVLQSGGNDCGAACLAMILRAHGLECNPKDLARRLSTTSRGTSLLNLRLVATGFGIPARSWLLHDADLGSVPLPVIAFIHGGHFVVVRKLLAPDLLEVDDPALGRLQWPVRSFRLVWPGQALVFDSKWDPTTRSSVARTTDHFTCTEPL